MGGVYDERGFSCTGGGEAGRAAAGGTAGRAEAGNGTASDGATDEEAPTEGIWGAEGEEALSVIRGTGGGKI